MSGSPLTATDVSTLESPNGDLVFRPTRMAVLIAPQGGSEVSTIVDATTGHTLTIPSDYVPVGYLEKKDGLGLAPKVTTSTSEAYGETQPIAYYITGQEFTATFTMKEHRKSVLQAYYGQDLSAVTADATTGEITWDTPSIPSVTYPRLLVVGQHRDGANAIWVAHWMPRVMITNMAEQKFDDQADITFNVTYTALVDSSVGTARRPFIAGPGLTPTLRTAMGF